VVRCTSCSCYLRLADNPRAKEALRSYLPTMLITPQMPFREAAESDAQLLQLLNQLRGVVGLKAEGAPGMPEPGRQGVPAGHHMPGMMPSNGQTQHMGNYANFAQGHFRRN
jgi:hypothetical protein